MSQWAAFRQTIWQAVAWSPVVLVVNDCILGFCKVSGTSMQPTLNPGETSSNDLVLVNKLSTRLFSYRRGDVVVLRSPKNPRELLVKRVIGIEGDWLLAAGHPDIIKVPKGCCWVEGDNAADSWDSASGMGPVPLALIDGRVLCVCWPRLQSVPSQLPRGKLLMRNVPDDDVKILP